MVKRKLRYGPTGRRTRRTRAGKSDSAECQSEIYDVTVLQEGDTRYRTVVSAADWEKIKVAFDNKSRLNDSKLFNFDGIVSRVDHIAMDLPSGRYFVYGGYAGWERSSIENDDSWQKVVLDPDDKDFDILLVLHILTAVCGSKKRLEMMPYPQCNFFKNLFRPRSKQESKDWATAKGNPTQQNPRVALPLRQEEEEYSSAVTNTKMAAILQNNLISQEWVDASLEAMDLAKDLDLKLATNGDLMNSLEEEELYSQKLEAVEAAKAKSLARHDVSMFFMQLKNRLKKFTADSLPRHLVQDLKRWEATTAKVEERTKAIIDAQGPQPVIDTDEVIEVEEVDIKNETA